MPRAGPTLRFHTDLVIAITGAAFEATLDGSSVPLWQSFKASKGSQLVIGKVEGEAGCRGYIAVGGGLDVPLYLGSRSTFPGGKLGGLQVGPALESLCSGQQAITAQGRGSAFTYRHSTRHLRRFERVKRCAYNYTQHCLL